MKNMINTTTIQGLIYENRLEKKISGPNSKNPNTEFIAGFLDVATDDECLNIVPVHFTYVTAVTSKGNANNTFNVLNSIINGTYKTIMKDGKENATKVNISSALSLNEFYSNRSGKEELVSTLRNEGGFVSIIDSLDEDEKKRNMFRCDMVINQVRHIDADDEKGTPEKAIIHGVIFDFRKAILPVDFTVLNPRAIDYFEGQEISSANPFFTQVWGRQISETVVKENHVESAFGEDYVQTSTSSRKDFVITGASADPYDWDTEETITAKELSEAMANREIELATIKTRQEEYQASKNSTTTTTTTNINKSSFNF